MMPPSKKDERLRDALAGVATLVFSLVLWFFLIPKFAGGHGDHTTLAAISAILIGGLALLLLILAVFKIPSTSTQAVCDDPFLEVGIGTEPPRLIVLGLVWGVFVVLLPFFGFYAAGAWAITASYIVLNVGGPKRIFLWVAGGLSVIYLIFDIGFKLRLPKGTLFDALLFSIG